MKINSVDKEVKDILQSHYFKIPRFQRPYSWEHENVEEFWADTIQENESEYFIGSMVVYKSTQDTFGVVDGQQRLTTITMILCALRNAFQKEGHEQLAKGIQQFIERPDLNNRPEYILRTETSYPYLQEHILKQGEVEEASEIGEEERALETAFQIIKVKIAKAVSEIADSTVIKQDDKPKKVEERLKAIRDKLLQLRLIFIEVDNEDDAYIIFETLNTRGKDLTTSDLIKNHLAKLLRQGNAGVDTTKDQWEKATDMLEGADLDINVFLHHLWSSQHQYVPSKRVFKEIRREVKKGNARDFLKELVEEAGVYRSIHDTGYKKWMRSEFELRSSLNALTIFRARYPLPFIMSVLRDYRAKKIKIKHVNEILQLIENFHFIFTAISTRGSSGGITMMYASRAREFIAADSAQNKLAVVETLRQKLQSLLPSKLEFQENFKKLEFTRDNTKQKRLIQYVLEKLDDNEDTGVPVDYSQMTIEHIAPENPSSGSPCAHVGRIGNLLLVSEGLNLKLDNKPFTEKMRILKTSKIRLDATIASETRWHDTEILARSNSMAELAWGKWKV